MSVEVRIKYRCAIKNKKQHSYPANATAKYKIVETQSQKTPPSLHLATRPPLLCDAATCSVLFDGSVWMQAVRGMNQKESSLLALITIDAY